MDKLSMNMVNQEMRRVLKGIEFREPKGSWHHTWLRGPKVVGPQMLDEGGIVVVVTASRDDHRRFYVKHTYKKGKPLGEGEAVDQAPQLVTEALERLYTHLSDRCVCRVPPILQSCPVSHYPDRPVSKPKR